MGKALAQRIKSFLVGSPAVASNTAIKAASATSSAGATVIDTGLTQPDAARNIVLTAGGTAGDIKAVQCVVAGTDVNGKPITETMPAFTVDTAGSVTGSKAFKTVTSVTVPAMDGNGATVAIGTGSKLGIPDALARNTVLRAFRNDVLEGTAPTVVTSAAEVASNTVVLNSALNGTPVRVDYYDPNN